MKTCERSLKDRQLAIAILKEKLTDELPESIKILMAF